MIIPNLEGNLSDLCMTSLNEKVILDCEKSKSEASFFTETKYLMQYIFSLLVNQCDQML